MLEDSTTNPSIRSDRLYLWIALSSTLLVVEGFARSYYLTSVFRFPALPVFLLLHGLVTMLWFALFFVQARIVSVHQMHLHRQLVSGGLALLTVAAPGTMVIRAACLGFRAFSETVKWSGLLLLSRGIPLTFAILIDAPSLVRTRSAIHKRLKVLASLGIWGPAISRLPPHLIETGSLLGSVAERDTCVLTCVAVDSIRNLRLNQAFPLVRTPDSPLAHPCLFGSATVAHGLGWREARRSERKNFKQQARARPLSP
jgi:hypothetical protein